MIYTSYYAKSGKHPNAVCVSVYPPPNLHGIITLDCFAPTMKMVRDIHKGLINQDEYSVLYIDLLLSRKINYGMIIKEFDEHIFCCYEKPGDFCHRHLLAAILESHGADVREL